MRNYVINAVETIVENVYSENPKKITIDYESEKEKFLVNVVLDKFANDEEVNWEQLYLLAKEDGFIGANGKKLYLCKTGKGQEMIVLPKPTKKYRKLEPRDIIIDLVDEVFKELKEELK